MAMSPTQEHDFRHQGDAPAERDGRSASPLLWGLLILLLIAAPAWWWIRNSGEQHQTIETAPATPSASEVLPPPAQKQSPAMVKQPQRSAPVIRNREARPLAGNAMPVYPPRALRAGVEGSVVARVSVDPRGQVSDVAIIQRKGARDRDLDRAVINAVRDWRFQPAMRDGHAVASTVQLPVDFKAQQ